MMTRTAMDEWSKLLCPGSYAARLAQETRQSGLDRVRMAGSSGPLVQKAWQLFSPIWE